MNYAVIGTGGIGGYYGAKLVKAGQEVHFLLHSDYKYVKQNGLQINSCKGDFHLDKVNSYNDSKQMPKCDVVLVCLKTTNNHLLPALLTPLLKPETIVLLIQNGIGVEEDVQKMFPTLQIAAGMAFICTAKSAPGTISHQDLGRINVASYSCKNTEQFTQMIADLNSANIEAKEVEYTEARWKKSVWNMPFNGMTVALNTQTNLLLANNSTRQLIHDLMEEVVTAAKACGVKNIDEGYINQMIEMTEKMKPYLPSMKLDFDFHRPMEIYYLYTRPIIEAQKVGVSMPKLKMLEQQLTFIEKGYLD